jgi:hypothetical protein
MQIPHFLIQLGLPLCVCCLNFFWFSTDFCKNALLYWF